MTSTSTRPRTLPCTADQVVRWALGQVGKTEDPPGSNSTPYGRDYGFDKVPWCGIFVWAAFRGAGAGDLRSYIGGATAYTPVFAELCRQAGWARVTPTQARAGDVVFFDFPRGNDRIEHVGIVRAQGGPGTLRTIEGNTSAGDGSQTNGGAVAAKERPYAHVRVIYRPPYSHPAVADQRFVLHRTLKVRRWVLMRGNDVKAVQRLVGAKVDGAYGPRTAAAVGAWQSRVHITRDGEFGPQSAKAAGWRYVG